MEPPFPSLLIYTHQPKRCIQRWLQLRDMELFTARPPKGASKICIECGKKEATNDPLVYGESTKEGIHCSHLSKVANCAKCGKFVSVYADKCKACGEPVRWLGKPHLKSSGVIIKRVRIMQGRKTKPQKRNSSPVVKNVCIGIIGMFYI